jgi:hypothetical protein
MKKISNLIILIIIVLILTNCNTKKSSSSKVNCIENEAYSFAKARVELTMQISASKTLSSSSESCEYGFYFEGLNNYNQCVENITTVKYTENGWSVIDCQVSKCR